MNKLRQRKIDAACGAAWGAPALVAFGTRERFQRFYRRFYSRHGRYPSTEEWATMKRRNNKRRKRG